MMGSQLGVLREDPHEDMRLMVENFTGKRSQLKFRIITLIHLRR